MSSVKAFLGSYSSHLVGGAFAMVGTGAIILDNHVGRNHTTKNFDTKIDGAKVELKADISRVEKKLESPHEDVQDL